MDEASGAAPVAGVGVLSIAAGVVGFVVLALGIRCAARRGTTSRALTLFAAAWLPLPIGLMGRSLVEIDALGEIVRRGTAVNSADLAAGLRPLATAEAYTLAGLVLGLAGAVAALARSGDAPRRP